LLVSHRLRLRVRPLPTGASIISCSNRTIPFSSPLSIHHALAVIAQEMRQ
jgi:hypothetical protein